jgi:hypothetical protein
MTRKTGSAGAIFALAIISWSSWSFAEGALAIGLSGNDPNNGFVVGVSHDEATAADAQAKALADCRGSDIKNTSKARTACKLIEVFRNQCANDAINGDKDTPSTAVGWAVGPDSKTTDSRAVAMCEVMRRNKARPCHPDGEPICDGDAK